MTKEELEQLAQVEMGLRGPRAADAEGTTAVWALGITVRTTEELGKIGQYAVAEFDIPEGVKTARLLVMGGGSAAELWGLIEQYMPLKRTSVN